MKKHPVWILIIGIFILVAPTALYLGFLIPQLSEEYNILMASGGVIGGFGMYGATKIPEKVKYSGLFKLAANSFTVLTVITLIQNFIIEIIGCIAVFIVCFIVFKILLEVWRDAKRRKENSKLAEEIARNITESSK